MWGNPCLFLANLSEGSAAVASPRYSQDIVIDFFSGIGGWQSGTNQRQVVSIDKDPVIASVHSKQTGARVIGANQILDLLLLDVESLPVILNFNVTDRRWWILFSLFRISYAVASPPCVSWSGASYAAGLDHEDGILFPETIAICDSHGVSRLALENVAAIRLALENVAAICLEEKRGRTSWRREGKMRPGSDGCRVE